MKRIEINDENTCRLAAAAHAEHLAGGEKGFTKAYDPLGLFHLVTEGRQASYVIKGNRVTYSACQDLARKVCQDMCGADGIGQRGVSANVRAAYDWINADDAWGWVASYNLVRIKNKGRSAWKNYSRKSAWDIKLGDSVEVHGKFGLHTFVVTALRYDAEGNPVSCDHADYGQFFDPDGPEGPEQAHHGCRVYRNKPIAKLATGWAIDGARIEGRVDLWKLVSSMPDRWHAQVPDSFDPDRADTLPAPPPSAPKQAACAACAACPDLRVGSRGEAVKIWQRIVGADDDGAFGPKTAAATSRWKASHGLPATGLVNRAAWLAAHGSGHCAE